MKKVIIFIGMLYATISLFTSCQQEVEVWDSATLDYSGRYVIKVMNEDMSETYLNYDNSEVYIYNTANNTPNEMWIEDMNQNLPLKSKFFFTGTPASFQSASMEFDKLTDNLFTTIVPPYDSSENGTIQPPTRIGENITLERPYLRAVVLEGKIIPQVVTTKGGNIADSLFLKLKLYSGEVTFKSALKPKKEWKDPTKEEFVWKYESVTYDATKDEIKVVCGHRYTGFSEDLY